jgi:uncharacterized protein
MRIRGTSVRALALAWLIACHASAADFEVPALRSAVTDQAGVLSPETRQQLELALRQLQSVGGTQLAVLTVPDLAGLTIEQASIRVVDAWKLGSKKADKGVLLLVARDERKVRIEVGQGLEGALTDAYSKRIIDEAITPLFKQGDMNGGVIMGVFQIARTTNPDVDLRPYLEGQLRQRSSGGRARSPWQSLFGILLMVAIFSTRRGMLPLMFLGGMGMGAYGARRGLGGFGGGGGGFGGFGGGGGGFSGGGASGGW